MTVSVPLTGADQQVFTGTGSYAGCALRATAGAAVVRVHDGTSASGDLIDVVALAAGASGGLPLPNPVRVGTGVFVEVVSGTVEGCVRVG